jgi:peptidyl-prolyl cis-trans isomerase C
MLKQILKISLVSLAFANAQAADSESIAVVNGKTLTKQDYDIYIESRAQQSDDQNLPNEETLINEIINQELVIQDGLKRKLDETPEFKLRIEKIRSGLLIQSALNQYWKDNVLSDATLKQEYDKILGEAKLPKEYKVKHILLKTEEEAKALILELEGGKDFGTLAKEKSTDVVSAEKNGDLGWQTKYEFAAPFSAALESLKKGGYTALPVQTQFGWHIIQLDDVRDSAPPTFESVKENVRKRLQQTEQMHDYVETLRKGAKIEILKKLTPPAAAPAPTTIPAPSAQPAVQPEKPVQTQPEN